ncbi:MAG TPA: hypothetical protein VFA43_07465 [Gemmatimonadaceae bacterium]|nr:hypothetical protein [Gemmatimonadaceae bacterium]
MPLPKALLESMAAKRREESVQANRDKFRDYARTALMCFVWCAVGTFFLAWSAHTTDEVLGRAAFWGGLGLGNAGIIFTLLAAYRRGEKRGDW